MRDNLSSNRSLESLKKEARRWLNALRAGSADARKRFESAIPNAPASPTLRDVQLALAREHGFPGWPALKQAFASRRKTPTISLAQYELMAEALLEAYRTGTREAMERHYRYTWHRRAWEGMRTYVQLDLGKRPSGPSDQLEITLDDARYLVALEYGFANWAALQTFTESAANTRLAAKPVSLVDARRSLARPIVRTREWDSLIPSLAMHPSARLHAEGQMTDAVLADVCRVENITELDLSGSKALTDDGIRHLSRLRQLKYLDLSGTAVTDCGLSVLQNLPALESVSFAMTAITDEGAHHLTHCPGLQRVNLSWTQTGDAALRALAGKERLCEFRSGNGITDAGLALLHELPVFKRWHGGEPVVSLLSHHAEPNYLFLRGSFTDRGMRHLKGLDGLFALNLEDSHLELSAEALAPLVSLPNLGWLAVDAKDDWMPYIAQMPRLRFLVAQDTAAGDDGFVALSKSQSIEYIWGRRCHNLRRRGFLALSQMRVLRGLSVSCLNVDDIGIAALPAFPALKELMPMDIPDAGYRHIGNCKQLESLVLMYCRDTTDAATEQITCLKNLSYYFNSYTTVTDRTPELLAEMGSLERITFDRCHGLTDAGITLLARLPRLRELRVSARNVTPAVAGKFPQHVTVFYEP